MLDKISEYKEIAEYLSEFELLNAIEQIEKALDNDKFVLSFMGQYSSGKSKLINNILNMDLLPTYHTETTAVITFIQYGEESGGRLVFIDGSSKAIPLEEISKIWQGNTEIEVRLDEIDYIEVLLNNSFLKSGLIIADTPGVNTIIEKHERITEQLILSTQEIIYVTAKTVTEYDYSMLRKIRDYGVKFSIVRTHMDTIKSAEESIDMSIEENSNKIKALMENDEEKIYYVSNEPGNKWNEGISELKNYITMELTSDVKANLQVSCGGKLQQIHNALSAGIEEKIVRLVKLNDSNQIEIIVQKEKLEKELKLAKELMKLRNQKLDKEISLLDEESMENLQCAKSVRLSDYKEDLQLVHNNQKCEEKIKELSYKSLKEAHHFLLENYYQPYEKLIQTNNVEINKELEDIDNLLGISEVPLLESIAEVKEDTFERDYSRQILIGKLNILTKEISEREKKIIQQREKIAENQILDEEIMNSLQQIEKELNELGEYKQQWVVLDNQSKQPSEILKELGKVADILTLLIPGKVYASLAAKTGKSVAALGKVLKTADSAKDILYSLKGINDVMNKTRETAKRTEMVLNVAETVKNGAQKIGILDFLTFEHWFEKVGKTFDRPKIEVDRDYEQVYYQEKSRLNEIYNKRKYIEIERKEQMGLFENDIEKQQELSRIEQKNFEKVKEELADRDKELYEKAKEISFARLKEDYIQWFTVKINELEKLIVINNKSKIMTLMENYKEISTTGIVKELNRMSQEHDKFMNFSINGEKDLLQVEINKCKEYKRLLNL